MIRCRRNHKARMNRLFRDQINPLKIFDDVELCVKFISRRVFILTVSVTSGPFSPELTDK